MATSRAPGGERVTTCSPISTSPAVGCSSPARHRSNVVFPAPEGPRRVRNSPSGTSSDTWCRMGVEAEPTVLVTPRRATADIGRNYRTPASPRQLAPGTGAGYIPAPVRTILAAAALVLLAMACDSPFTPPRPTSGTPVGVPATMTERPDSANLFADDTIQMLATVKDSAGQILVMNVT